MIGPAARRQAHDRVYGCDAWKQSYAILRGRACDCPTAGCAQSLPNNAMYPVSLQQRCVAGCGFAASACRMENHRKARAEHHDWWRQFRPAIVAMTDKQVPYERKEDGCHAAFFPPSSRETGRTRAGERDGLRTRGEVELVSGITLSREAGLPGVLRR